MKTKRGRNKEDNEQIVSENRVNKENNINTILGKLHGAFNEIKNEPL